VNRKPALKWKLWGREEGDRGGKGKRRQGVPFLLFPLFPRLLVSSVSSVSSSPRLLCLLFLLFLLFPYSPSISSFPIRILTVCTLVSVYILDIKIEITITAHPVVQTSLAPVVIPVIIVSTNRQMAGIHNYKWGMTNPDFVIPRMIPMAGVFSFFIFLAMRPSILPVVMMILNNNYRSRIPVSIPGSLCLAG
jgi:hypothetical protein